MDLKQAAKALDRKPETLRKWISQSKKGTLVIRGRHVVLDFMQSGERGQGKITLEPQEIERIKNLLRPQQQVVVKPRRYRRQHNIGPTQHITVMPGRPD